MNNHGTKGQRLVALCLLGTALFNYPLLSLFSHDHMILGIPILYAYIFLAWIGLVGLMMLVVEKLR